MEFEMTFSRRGFLALGLGATQLALLERFGLNRARAGSPSGGPTKLLSLYVVGGLSHEQIWCALSDAGVATYIPTPMGGAEPYFYNAKMVKNYDGTSGDDGAFQKIRGPIWWNPNKPSDNLTTPNPDSGGTQNYIPWGYSWVTRDLSPQAVYERAVMVHGIDQGTAAHASGLVASLCGIAGGDFRAPAIAAVVANAMMSKFPDRALPSIAVGNAPAAVALSTAANPISGAASPMFLDTTAGLLHTISDVPDSAWAGLRARTDFDEVGFDGMPTGKKIPLTAIDAQVMKATRALRGASTNGTDAFLQELYETYGGVSRSLAKNLVDLINKTPGAQYLPTAMPWAPDSARFGWRLGLADGGSDHEWDDRFDLALRLLKSDLATSVTVRVTGAGNYAFDTHGGPSQSHINQLRGTYEIIGRLIIEMMLTPSTVQPGKTLLDDTVVQIFSEFGRTFSQPLGGTDHHPATSMILLGGNVHGNRMIGGYDETIPSSPLGRPVDVINIEEGGGSTTSRVPRAADAAATVFRAFGLEAGKDFFIPGGYGEIKGALDS
jgi:hypothetical protein